MSAVRTAPPAVEPAGSTSAGLTREEYEAICAGLGRPPTHVESRCFAVMWSEHCAYKHSKEVLRRLPATGRRVLQGPGENAGVVEITDGWALVWKMESHNHPSAVDPFNGAATGVGGIIRDVLAMGARPVALLDSLRFGPLDRPRDRRLLQQVVAGIAAYGNSIGVPTIGGEVAVDRGYAGNPVVNVACLGLVRTDGVARGRADRPGTVFLYAGARTGRDGIGGAAFASETLGHDAGDADRAAVQIGDPFAGKCLIEATLEALATGRVAGLQDMGAGGITCAAAEMAARGGCGATLELDCIPLRVASLPPQDVLLSESQERMLLVVDAADADHVASIYARWGLTAAVVGRVTADGRFRAVDHGALVADLPLSLLTEAPTRRVEAETGPVPAVRIPATPPEAGGTLLRLLAQPEVASKSPIYEQYDHMVQVRTVVRPGLDAAVLRLPEAHPIGLAVSTDGNARWCSGDPCAGGMACVLEAAANLACAGATPVAVTDCLNFASPKDPRVMGQFIQAVDGIAAACRALGVPVVGGNVSFYNEGPEGPIPPTPVVAMVGVIRQVPTSLPRSPREGDVVVLFGAPEAGLDASLYDRVLGGCGGAYRRPALPAAVRTIYALRDAVAQGLIVLAHDVSDGGPAVAAAECCLASDLGMVGYLPDAGGRDVSLFGEGGMRALAIIDPGRLADVRDLAGARGVPSTVLGRMEGTLLRLSVGDEAAIDVTLRQMRTAWSALNAVV